MEQGRRGDQAGQLIRARRDRRPREEMPFLTRQDSPERGEISQKDASYEDDAFSCNIGDRFVTGQRTAGGGECSEIGDGDKMEEITGNKEELIRQEASSISTGDRTG